MTAVFESTEEMEQALVAFAAILDKLRERAIASGDEFGRDLFAEDNPEAEQMLNLMSTLTNCALRVGTTSPELLALGMVHPMGMTWVLLKFAMETGYIVGRASGQETTEATFDELIEAVEVLAKLIEAAPEGQSTDPLEQILSQNLQDGEIVN